MFLLKYLVFGLFVVGTCRALNFKDIKAKIQKRKGFLPNRLLKPVIAPNPTLPLKHYSNETKPAAETEEPQVKILDSRDFSTTMTLTAAVILRKALNMFPENPCEVVRGVFQRLYGEYEWQCVDYNMVAVESRKSINLEVKDKKYLLFATNKSGVVEIVQ